MVQVFVAGLIGAAVTAPLLAFGPLTAAAAPRPHRAAAAGEGQAFFATVTPSPFLHTHATARIVVRTAGGEAVPGVHVAVEGDTTAFRLSPPTAAERRRGVVALVTAGARPGRATAVVSVAASRRQQALPLKSFTHPEALVAGKGAWVAFDTYGAMSAAALLDRMRREGITHVYVETGGVAFTERAQLNALLGAAHNLGIAVIACVWAPLDRLRREVDSAGATIAYRAADGAMVDGFAGDFEKNLAPGAVRAFSAAVRRDLGRHRVYVACIYAPQLGFPTPIATLARYVNAFAPMDYWLGRPWTSPAHRASGYVTRSIWELRHAPGEGRRAIEVISQTADVVNASGVGPLNPSAAQVRAAARAARAAGAVGVSFYELLTQTRAQIAAIAAFTMPWGAPA